MAELRKKEIREIIKGQAQNGWILAFQLCGDISDDRAKKKRYELINKIPGLSVKEKIDICEQYLTIEEVNDNTEKASVYWDLAKLNAQKEELLEINEVSHVKTTYYLEQYYNNSTEQIKAVEIIIQFCRNYKLTNEMLKWQKVYVHLCQQSGVMTENADQLLQVLLSLNQIENAKDLIEKLGIDQIKSKYIDQLISYGLLDTAESLLDRMAENERKNNPVSSKMGWIESVKYRMKYYRMGYTFFSSWTPISYFDYCSNSNAKNIEKGVDSLKLKYWKPFSQHRCCLTDFELYNYSSKENKESLLPIYIAACEKDIEVIPQILSFIDDFRKLIGSIPKTEKLYNIQEIMNGDKYKLANCAIFKKLAIYYEKALLFDDAIRVCDKAISCGYIDDGTKMGMFGREKKILLKKYYSMIEGV